jgi:hypothetical protein
MKNSNRMDRINRMGKKKELTWIKEMEGIKSISYLLYPLHPCKK